MASPDIDYWQDRAREAEAKVKELEAKLKDYEITTILTVSGKRVDALKLANDEIRRLYFKVLELEKKG